jgi:hypothetical protein
VVLERGQLGLMSTTEELLGRKGSVSGLDTQEYSRRGVVLTTFIYLFIRRLCANLADKWQSLGRNSLFMDSGHGVI